MIEIRRAAHPKLVWVVEHMVTLYIAVIVTVMLPLVILNLYGIVP